MYNQRDGEKASIVILYIHVHQFWGLVAAFQEMKFLSLLPSFQHHQSKEGKSVTQSMCVGEGQRFLQHALLEWLYTYTFALYDLYVYIYACIHTYLTLWAYETTHVLYNSEYR